MKFFVQMITIGLVLNMVAPPVRASKLEHLPVTKTVVLNAPTNTVWKALREVRATDSTGRHVVSTTGAISQVQENFEVPVIGPVSCIYQEREVEGRRVEYHLVRSSNFIAFEGAWDVAPCAGGKQTQVTLTSFADTGSHMPFASKVTRNQTVQRVDMRMNELKNIVEHHAIAALPR